MYKMIQHALVCLLAALPAFGADENLILNRKHSYFPVPDYHDTKDSDDYKQLTDGVTQYAGGMWLNKSCVGWSSGVDVPVVMLFDLGEEATVNELPLTPVAAEGQASWRWGCAFL